MRHWGVNDGGGGVKGSATQKVGKKKERRGMALHLADLGQGSKNNLCHWKETLAGRLENGGVGRKKG